jgi:hypothetical protein
MKAPVLEIASAAALERRLSRTLRDLAAIGDKRAGSAAGAASATYIQDRMNAAGVGNVRLETFRFASFVLRGSAFRAGGRDLAHEVLAYSGCGPAAAPLVHVGTGESADYDGLDLSGRIALAERNVTFHRSAQYREAVARGAAGLVYISHAPENLIPKSPALTTRGRSRWTRSSSEASPRSRARCASGSEGDPSTFHSTWTRSIPRSHRGRARRCRAG